MALDKHFKSETLLLTLSLCVSVESPQTLKGSATGSIIGGILGVIIFLAIIATVVVIVRKRQRKNIE